MTEKSLSVRVSRAVRSVSLWTTHLQALCDAQTTADFFQQSTRDSDSAHNRLKASQSATAASAALKQRTVCSTRRLCVLRSNSINSHGFALITHRHKQNGLPPEYSGGKPFVIILRLHRSLTKLSQTDRLHCNPPSPCSASKNLLPFRTDRDNISQIFHGKAMIPL